MNSTRPVVSQQPWNQNPLNTLSIMKLPGSLLNRAILEKTIPMTAFVLIEVGCLQKMCSIRQRRNNHSKNWLLAQGELLNYSAAYPEQIGVEFWHLVYRASQDGWQPRPKYLLFPLGAPEENWRWKNLPSFLEQWVPGLTSYRLKCSLQPACGQCLLRGSVGRGVIILLFAHILWYKG